NIIVFLEARFVLLSRELTKMAPKKKKVIRKKSSIPMTPFDYNPPNVFELGVKPYLYVKCKICCTALPHLNFEWPAVPTDLTLSAIKEAIVKRHGGSLPKLTLFKGAPRTLTRSPFRFNYIKGLGMRRSVHGRS
ncbi:hypothetical protein Vretimale_18207, partial [Volvox reticuliferus]